MDIDNMDTYQMDRWGALIEAVQLINETSKKWGVQEKDTPYNQLHILRYIDERTSPSAV